MTASLRGGWGQPQIQTILRNSKFVGPQYTNNIHDISTLIECLKFLITDLTDVWLWIIGTENNDIKNWKYRNAAELLKKI